MRHNNNRNQRHHNNNRNNQRHHNNGGGFQRRGPVSLKQQTFDSNGPDVRIRGNAWQVCEKYQSLAKDAALSGDYVMSESYAQFAEHYQRLINEYNEQNGLNAQGQPENQQPENTEQNALAEGMDLDQTSADLPQTTAEAELQSNAAEAEQTAEPQQRRNPRGRRPATQQAGNEGEALRRTGASRAQQALPDADELGLPATLFKRNNAADKTAQDDEALEAANA